MSEIVQSSLAEIAEALRAAERVVVISHVRPDGDAIGSQVALGSCLRAMGKEVTLLNEDGCPSNLAFLPESETVGRPDGTVTADLLVALDTANKERLGAGCIEATAEVPVCANIDHHISNGGYGELVHIDPLAPATGQIVFELIERESLPLTSAARDCLFVAISTDTGSFQYPSTTARTYEIGAALIRAGADCGALSSQAYERYPYRRIELMRGLLNVLQLSADGRVASWALDLILKDELDLRPEDSENLIDVIRAIDTVEVAVFFEELRDSSVRVSMRSKSRAADVCQICSEFGGGGHPPRRGRAGRGCAGKCRRASVSQNP